MRYTEAIQWLKDNDYKKDDGSYYEIGEDIPEVRRGMTVLIGMTKKMINVTLRPLSGS